MRTSDEIADIAGALAEAQGALRPAVKDAVNPAYKSKYADLASVWEACRAALPQFGLAVIQDVTNLETEVAVTTRITHKSGQWIECGPLLVPMTRADAHGLGSAVSYGKRYALSAALGIVAEEDDDGNGAVGSRNGQAAEKAVAGILTAASVPDPITTGLIGMAEKGKGQADFELRQSPTGHVLIFRLTEGRKGWKVVARDILAEQIAEFRTGIEGQRVTCWGSFTDESFLPKGAREPVVYQILNLTRLKVGILDLSAPEPEDADLSPEEQAELAQLPMSMAIPT